MNDTTLATPQSPNDPEVLARRRILERQELERIRDGVLKRIETNASIKQLMLGTVLGCPTNLDPGLKADFNVYLCLENAIIFYNKIATLVEVDT